MKKIVYLSLGSNVGDRKENLQACIARLEQVGTVLRVSSLYETEPMELRAQPWFLNCAVALETEKMPRQLLSAIQVIERDLGRSRTVRKGPRTIDIDVLLFASSVIQTASLVVPHPAMHLRRFVLEPLAEIAPDVRHPIFRRTARELLADLGAEGGTVSRKKTISPRRHGGTEENNESENTRGGFHRRDT